MLLPPKRLREAVQLNLEHFYKDGSLLNFSFAVEQLTDFYEVRVPAVMWKHEIDEGKNLGHTSADGSMALIAPLYWPRQMEGADEKMWIKIFFHEFWDFLVWVNEEEKADEYAEKMYKQ